MKWTLLVLLSALLATAGCGSSSDATATSPSGNASEFLEPGGKGNKYAEFGREASDAEREAASKVLEENLAAREKGDWAEQCSSLTAGAIKKVGGPKSSEEGSRCPAALKQLAAPLLDTVTVRADTLTGSIDVLMVKGSHAYALYHGAKGKDYAMRMGKEEGRWKVDSLLTEEIP